MTKLLRNSFSLSAAAFGLILTVAPAAFCQTANPGAANLLTNSQTPVSLPGNYAIIPPGKFEKTESKKNEPAKPKSDSPKSDSDAATPDSGPAAPGNSQISGLSGLSGLNDRAQSQDRNAPRRESLQAIKIAGKHVKALIGGFEQGAGFGVGVELTTADSVPGIEFRAKLLTSSKFYRRFEGQAYIPKLGSEKTHLDLWFNYQLRTKDRFFGLGPRTPDNQETNYASDERSFNAVLSHDLAKRSQIGVYVRVANTDGYRGEKKDQPPIDGSYTGRPPGKPGTVFNSTFLPGLNTNAKIFSYGAFAEIDYRNNEVGLTKGGYAYARFASADGLKNDFFDDFGWNEVELDGRAYIPLFSDSTSLALRAYADLRDPKRGSQIPFYELAWLGGRSYGRGFTNFRFHDNNVVLFSVEPRQTVWKQKEDRGVDVFAFGDGGQVWGDNRSAAIRRVSEFDSQNWRFAFGGGVQYRRSKSLAVRLEIGHSNESNKVYFSLSRGF